MGSIRTLKRALYGAQHRAESGGVSRRVNVNGTEREHETENREPRSVN